MQAAVPSPWYASLPPLARLEPPARAVLDRARPLSVDAGTPLFRPGSPCSGFVVVLEGEVRVTLGSATGREVVLYHVSPGEPCILTTACLLGSAHYPAEGVTSAPTRLVQLGQEDFQELLRTSERFRTFVFATFGDRILDLTRLVDAVAFGRLDGRLAEALLDGVARQGSALSITHRELAAEVGTAREVVSRQLEAFQRSGLVRLARGRIEVLDTEALRARLDGS